LVLQLHFEDSLVRYVRAKNDHRKNLPYSSFKFSSQLVIEQERYRLAIRFLVALPEVLVEIRLHFVGELAIATQAEGMPCSLGFSATAGQ
jgi:hypothetical protein